MTNKIVCFDIEMCCWSDKSPGDIIEFSLAEIDLDLNQITRTSQHYITPVNDEISDYCFKLTGISQQKINKCGKPLQQAIQSISTSFGKNSIFCAWGRDDIVIHRQCETYNISTPIKEFINGSTLYNIHNRSMDRKINMYKAMQQQNIPSLGNAHSGLDDATNLAYLMLHILRK